MAPGSSEATPVLQVRGARKSFGSIQALAGADLSLHEREVLALLGDNGAGKSTLVKAISGVHPLDDGEILLEGLRVRIRTPAHARQLGIETVYQDLAVFDNLDVVANFFIGREQTSVRWLRSLAFLRERSMARDWARYADRLEAHVPSPDQPVGLKSGGQRQAVAVARAVAFASRIVILDEPTAALGLREAGRVLDLVRRLPEEGVSVILISHNLEHVTHVADRAVVLRQGRNVGEAVPSAENHGYLVALIVGSVGARGTELNDVRRHESPEGSSTPTDVIHDDGGGIR